LGGKSSRREKWRGERKKRVKGHEEERVKRKDVM